MSKRLQLADCTTTQLNRLQFCRSSFIALLTEGFVGAAAPVKGGFIREALSAQYPRLAATLEEIFRRIVQDTDVRYTTGYTICLTVQAALDLSHACYAAPLRAGMSKVALPICYYRCLHPFDLGLKSTQIDSCQIARHHVRKCHMPAQSAWLATCTLYTVCPTLPLQTDN